MASGHNKQEAKSGDNGGYIFTHLQPGNYKLTVTIQDFKTFSNPSLDLVAGDRARVDTAMATGGSSETIEVTTQPSALQTDNTTVGSNIDSKAVLTCR